MLTGKSANNLLIEVNKSHFCNVLWLQIYYPLVDKEESNGKRKGVNLNWQQLTNKTYKRQTMCIQCNVNWLLLRYICINNICALEMKVLAQHLYFTCKLLMEIRLEIISE